MAPKTVGFEDFVVLEGVWKGKRNPSHYQSPPKKEAINSHDAAKIYGGLLIVDNRRNKNQPRREAIDCIEAAQKFGGMLVIDYKKQPLRMQAYN